jgi:hypothetical protein
MELGQGLRRRFEAPWSFDTESSSVERVGRGISEDKFWWCNEAELSCPLS